MIKLSQHFNKIASPRKNKIVLYKPTTATTTSKTGSITPAKNKIAISCQNFVLNLDLSMHKKVHIFILKVLSMKLYNCF